MSAEDFGVVRIETRFGDVYLFPAMNKAELVDLLGMHMRHPNVLTLFLLVNASKATLSLPIEIIKEVQFDREVLWPSPV